MNDLYLIGNGFDLAHGLKTSYNDFLLWYLKHSISRISPNKHFEDDLIIVDRVYSNPIQDHNSLLELFAEIEQLHISIKYKHGFLERIIKSFREYRWVDIEYEYYIALIQLYKDLELNPHTRKSVLKELMQLNFCFESIKKKLVEYLTGLEISSKIVHKQIEQMLREYTGFERQIGLENSKKLFVNFNYTSTIKLYNNDLINDDKLDVINIHGMLNDEDNPVIFGYGDEMDPHYEKIENLNNNEFLKNIKSFGYFRTDNYQRVMRFIEGFNRDFTVKILGHSCGLSDRILLNSIFEHPNCKFIKIYHYNKSLTENDYFEKIQEISRHFKSSAKGIMRMKIIPFDKNNSMPQVKKDN